MQQIFKTLMLAKVVIDYENHSSTEQLLQRNKEINLENSQLRPRSVHTYVIQMNKFANTIKAKMKLQKHVKNTKHQANHRDKNSDIANKRKKIEAVLNWNQVADTVKIFIKLLQKRLTGQALIQETRLHKNKVLT